MTRILLFFLSLVTVALHADEQTETIPWMHNYEKAKALSEESGKPLFMLFTGSDWCPWCIRLESEVLTSKDFIQSVANQFVFVYIDRPMKKELPAEQKAHNEALFDKFPVKTVPTVMMVDTSGEIIGHSGYRPGGGPAYAEFLLTMVNDFAQLKETMLSFKAEDYSDVELEELYREAQGFDTAQFSGAIMGAALQNGDSTFFMLERYRELVKEGKHGDEATRELRDKLLATTSEAPAELHFEVAILDYEGLTALPQAARTADDSTAPLQEYLEQFGTNDPERAWKARMLISQSLLGERKLEDAKRFAKEALAQAPEAERDEIAILIKTIEEQLVQEEEA